MSEPTTTETVRSMGAGDTAQFQIDVVSPDEKGCRFYLDRYKPFRLKALQSDPDAFGSTYARELAFDDDAWLARVKNPSATTYLAVRTADKGVVASTALIGPLPDGPPASNPYQTLVESNVSGGGAASTTSTDADNAPIFFQMSAVYTAPQARGCGLAKTLITAAAEEASRRAVAAGRPLVLSVVVYPTNSAAIAVYERCGFMRSADGPELAFNEVKNSSEARLHMFFSPNPVTNDYLTSDPRKTPETPSLSVLP